MIRVCESAVTSSNHPSTLLCYTETLCPRRDLPLYPHAKLPLRTAHVSATLENEAMATRRHGLVFERRRHHGATRATSPANCQTQVSASLFKGRARFARSLATPEAVLRRAVLAGTLGRLTPPDCLSTLQGVRGVSRFPAQPRQEAARLRLLLGHAVFGHHIRLAPRSWRGRGFGSHRHAIRTPRRSTATTATTATHTRRPPRRSRGWPEAPGRPSLAKGLAKRG